MSALPLLSNYVSVIRIDGSPILPPLMTAKKRKESAAWRAKALQVSKRLPVAPKQQPVIQSTSENSFLTDLEEEDESPVLSAYASRFGSGLEVKNYLSGLVPNSPPPPTSSTKRAPSPPPSREVLRASLSELDRQRDEAIQTFLEDQSRLLIQLKKKFAEQRRELVHQLNASPDNKKQHHLRIQSPSLRISPKQKKAFSKLSALIKGYLVRRLMATVKVQDILNSLKDSLKMALQLHQEAARNHKSTESDVNLHKTLLQQINRDVKRFHDIFFECSVEERMKIIALDREERKKEKPTKKFLSEATKQRIKQKMGDSELNKENRPNSARKSPQVSNRTEKSSKTSPRKSTGVPSSKPSPRIKKVAKIDT